MIKILQPPLLDMNLLDMTQPKCHTISQEFMHDKDTHSALIVPPEMNIFAQTLLGLF